MVKESMDMCDLVSECPISHKGMAHGSLTSQSRNIQFQSHLQARLQGLIWKTLSVHRCYVSTCF